MDLQDRIIQILSRPITTVCESIWGLGPESYVYHVVTAGDLRPTGLKWVSKDATYTVSSTSSSGESPRAALLTGGSLDSRSSAFYIRQDSPNITITLKREAAIKRILIENTRSRSKGYANGLTVLVSVDKRRWRKIWTARTVQPYWKINLKRPVKAKYIRLGLNRVGSLHLAHVWLFE